MTSSPVIELNKVIRLRTVSFKRGSIHSSKASIIGPTLPGVVTSGGTVLLPPAASPKAQTAAVASYKQFQILVTRNLVGGTWDGTYNVPLYPGTLNQVVPDNILDVVNVASGGGLVAVYLNGYSDDGLCVAALEWSAGDPSSKLDSKRDPTHRAEPPRRP